MRNTTTVFGATSRGPHSINPRVDAVVRSQNAYQRFSDDEEENYETTQREQSPLKPWGDAKHDQRQQNGVRIMRNGLMFFLKLAPSMLSFALRAGLHLIWPVSCQKMVHITVLKNSLPRWI